MQTMTYGRYRIELIEGAGGYIRPTGREHLPAPAIRQVRAPTTMLPAPVGRTRQVAHAVRALGEGRVVNLYGPCGIGKSTLLRHLALTAGRALNRPGAYLEMQADEPAEDVVQRLLHILGLVEPNVRATPEQSAQVLAAIRPIVVVDNDACDAAGLSDLVSRLPDCGIIVGSERSVGGRDGISYELPGLDDEDALTLLSRDAGRELTADEQAAAARLTGAVGGRPLPLRQAAALVRAGIDSFEELADAVERDKTALARRTMTGLDRTERNVFGILAVLSGTLLPADLVEIIGDSGNCREALAGLRDRHVIDSSDDRFGLPACRAPDIAEHFFRTFDMTTAVRDIVRYVASSSPGGDGTLSLAKAVVTLIGVLAKRQQWKSVVALVEVAEPILTLAGRWATCRRLLDLGVHAAHEVGDLTAEAMFRHEQGTLALCSGQVDEAREQLTRAWRLRRHLGNNWAADITLHNLRLLASAPPESKPAREPAPPARRRLDRQWAIAGAGVATLVLVTGLVSAATGGDVTAEGGRASTTPTASGRSTSVSPSPTASESPTRKTPGSPQTPGDPDSGSAESEPPELMPRLANLGRFHVGSREPPPQVFTLRNDSGVTVAFGPPRTTNESFVVSAEADACRGVVAPHAACTFTVGFAPKEIGRQEGDLVVPIQGFPEASAHLTATGFRTLTVVIVKTPVTFVGEVTGGSGVVRCSTGTCVHEFSQTPIELTAIGRTCVGCSTEWTRCPVKLLGLRCSIDLVRDRSVTATFAFKEP